MLRRIEWMSVSPTAETLGTSDGAVRKRVARGSLRRERDGEGRVWVLLTGSGTVAVREEPDLGEEGRPWWQRIIGG
jgi:hypothetical protein